MPDRGMGRVYQPKRACLRCKGAGCGRCQGSGRRQIEIWWIQFSSRSRQYRESSGSLRKADAINYLKKRVAEVHSGKRCGGPEAERVTFEDLVQHLRDDYNANRRKSTRRLETSIDRLKEYFAGYRAVDITPDSIRSYLRKRLEQGREPSTVKNELNALRRAFRLAHEAGKVPAVPHFPRIEVDAVRQGFFEAEAFYTVVAHLPANLGPIAEFGYLSGWRLGEILPLRWSQVDMTLGLIRLEVGSTKNNDGRVLPFSVLPQLKALMERQLAYTQRVEEKRSMTVEFVFHRNGREVKSMRKAWDLACAAADCPGRLFHDLRRTAVRNLERACVPRSIAMKITGHKTEAIYKRYAIVNERDLADGLGRLATYMAGQEPTHTPPIVTSAAEVVARVAASTT